MHACQLSKHARQYNVVYQPQGRCWMPNANAFARWLVFPARAPVLCRSDILWLMSSYVLCWLLNEIFVCYNISCLLCGDAPYLILYYSSQHSQYICGMWCGCIYHILSPCSSSSSSSSCVYSHAEHQAKAQHHSITVAMQFLKNVNM